MSAKLLTLCVIGLALLAIGFTGQNILASGNMELWYQHACYLTTEDAVQKSKDLIDKAASLGYTGILLWDSGFNMMGNRDWDPDNEDRMKEVLKYARKRHLKAIGEAAPFGWSNDVLAANPNWAEEEPVEGQKFQVAPDGKSLKVLNTLPPFVNGNFAAGETAWFDLHDPGIKIIPNARGGNAAIEMSNPAGNARIRQKISVHPWRQYHLSFFYKTTGNDLGSPMLVVYDGSSFDKVRFESNPGSAPTWQQFNYLFQSFDSTSFLVYVGVWGGAKGSVEFNDIQLEETGPIWVAHREGAPFKVYDPNNPSKVYKQGVDYKEVIDPDMLPHRPCFQNNFHWPPPFNLPATTELKPGQIVAVDYYAATPIMNNNQVGMCMTDPGVFDWLTKNAHEIHKVLPQESSLLLFYDEIRHANTCASCRAKNMTAGELLAWNFGKTYGIYRDALPGTSFWVWSDMFDPYHNAHDNVAYVEGNASRFVERAAAGSLHPELESRSPQRFAHLVFRSESKAAGCSSADHCRLLRSSRRRGGSPKGSGAGARHPRYSRHDVHHLERRLHEDASLCRGRPCGLARLCEERC